MEVGLTSFDQKVLKSAGAVTRQNNITMQVGVQSCVIGAIVSFGCGLQHYLWPGYTGLTWSQLWPVAFTYVTGACWVTVAWYPLLCVNLITALRVIRHLSPACSSGFLFVQQWCMQFQGGLVIISFRETLRLFHGWCFIYIRLQRDQK